MKRSIIKHLEDWIASGKRKPLLLRGARQVGKTTAVTMFARRFQDFIHLSLENPGHRRFFRENTPFEDILKAIMFEFGFQSRELPLLFIDEIQESPVAMRMLRFFREHRPEIPVICAGSLLELALFREKIEFPVGRVTNLYMYPLSFREFLHAMGESESAKLLDTVPLPDYARDKLLRLFHGYAIIGGMPEVVREYSGSRELAVLCGIYDDLLIAFNDDILKYCTHITARNVTRHCLEAAPLYAGQRITLTGFGNSGYRARETGEALRNLERAMLIRLVYPTTAQVLPLAPDLKKSPRLQFLDTGLMNYACGMQGGLFGICDLHEAHRGRLAEHVVRQELLAANPCHRKKVPFWVRERAQAQAEVDILIAHDGTVVPVEVKSGAAGRLRSLHQFLERSGTDLAVRLYSGRLCLETHHTASGKPYSLLNLPYFLSPQLHDYISWARESLP